MGETGADVRVKRFIGRHETGFMHSTGSISLQTRLYEQLQKLLHFHFLLSCCRANGDGGTRLQKLSIAVSFRDAVPG
jgi:hypothetical protein